MSIIQTPDSAGNVRKAVKKPRLSGPTAITEKIELRRGECWIGLKPGSNSGVEARTHTGAHTHAHTHTQNQVESREPFNTHLRPRLKRQSTSSPGALQHRASPHAPPNFTHGCTPVEVFYSGFWCVSAEPHCSKYLFFRLEAVPDC